MTDTTGFESFAIVEIMGHRVVAGKVTEETVAGKALVRIETLPPEGQAPVVQLYGPDAIFCITPCTEEQARRACSVYTPTGAARAALMPAGVDNDWDIPDDDDDEDEDEDEDEIDDAYQDEQRAEAIANGFLEGHQDDEPGDLRLVET